MSQVLPQIFNLLKDIFSNKLGSLPAVLFKGRILTSLAGIFTFCFSHNSYSTQLLYAASYKTL